MRTILQVLSMSLLLISGCGDSDAQKEMLKLQTHQAAIEQIKQLEKEISETSENLSLSIGANREDLVKSFREHLAKLKDEKKRAEAVRLETLPDSLR
jgi:hypothetical protein